MNGQDGLFVVSPLGSARERPKSYWAEVVREVSRAKTLEHSNVLRVVDLGELEGQRYLVAEYERGVPFDTLIQQLVNERDRLPLSEVLGLGLMLSDTLAVLHGPREGNAAPFVHGRIAPSGIVLSREGVPKLGGFADPSVANLAYQAPEQLLGLAPDGRADVFALSVVLLELLLGQRVFQRADAAGTIGAVLGGEPLPPLEVVGHELRPKVTEVFERGLARDRDQRPSAREYHSELHEIASQLEEDLAPASATLTRHLDVAEAKSFPKITTSAEAPLTSDARDSQAVPLAPPETGPSRGRGIGMAALAGLMIGGLMFLGARSVLSPEAEAPKRDEAEAPPPPAPGAISGAHRAAGMEALEAADYTLAITEFETALAAPNPKADLDRLLTIARNLQSRAEAPPVEAQPTAPPTEPPPPVPTEAEEDPTGLLLVTTEPPGLLVYVDGAVKDMSPARLTLPLGRHRLVIRRGKRRLVDRKVLIKRDSVVPVDFDLTEQVAALESPPPPKDEEKAPAKEEPADPQPTAETPPIAREGAEASDRETAPADDSEATKLSAAGAPSSTIEEEPTPPEPIATPAPEPLAPKPPPAVPSATVRKTMGSSSKEFEECYYRQLMRDERARGSVLLTMMVAPTGRVSSVSMRSSFANSKMKRCLRREIERLRFPEHPHSTPIPARFRLVFQPAS